MSVHGAANVGGPLIVAIDTGIKLSIVKNFVSRGARVELHPARTPASELRDRGADAFFLANGPGDPSTMGYAVENVKKMLGTGKPLFGICLGQQLLAQAVGLPTYKLHHGHRGINHPVKNLKTGLGEITSQNHGFAVLPETLPKNARVTHVSLFDGTNEGIAAIDRPAFSVQYHPEASPGPQDAHYLFKRFVDLIAKEKAR